MNVSWSEANSKFACKERLFDGIIERAKALEANEVRRETETDQLLKQRKRGTTSEDKVNNKSNISASVGAPNNRHNTKSSAHNVLSQPSRHNTQTDTIDTVSLETCFCNCFVQHTRTQAGGQNAASAAKGDEIAQMGQTLMARMGSMNRTMPVMNGGKKDMGNTGNSSANIASKATATGMTMTGTQKQQMSQTMFGASSAFRNTTERGIVSGMGLLTF